jgi:hypothetical protein
VSFSISNSNNNGPAAKRFVIAFCAMLLLLLSATLVLRHILFKTGDFLAEEEIVRLQRSTDGPCIYSEYGKQNEALYKFELYRAIKPDIVVLGSSRVLEMNQRQFNAPFVNLGRVMTDIKRGTSAVEELLKIHKPKFMLIGLDQYWFNPNWKEAGVAKVKLTSSDPNDPRAILRLTGLILREGLWTDVWQSFTQGPECHIGISAKHYLSGYADDGYRYYGELFTGNEPHEDRKFGMTLGRIKSASRRFEKSNVISPEQFAQLLKLHQLLKDNGILHLFFLPTFAPTVVAEMNADGGYGYIADLERAIIAAQLPFVEVIDPALDDCDFIDGFHTGDAAQARQLQSMGRARPELGVFLNIAELAKLSLPDTPPTYYIREDLGLESKDYLELGCAWRN